MFGLGQKVVRARVRVNVMGSAVVCGELKPKNGQSAYILHTHRQTHAHTHTHRRPKTLAPTYIPESSARRGTPSIRSSARV